MRKIGYDIFVGGGKFPEDKKPARFAFVVILAAITLVAGGFFAYRYIRPAQPVTKTVAEEKNELKIYYPSDRTKLILKSIPVKNFLTDKEKVDAIVANLKNNKAIPETLSLSDFVSDVDGTLILNFSPDIAAMKPDPLKEIQMVYSIVNSFLANFTRAKRVQFLAGGQALITPGGTVYTYKPLEFNSFVLED